MSVERGLCNLFYWGGPLYLLTRLSICQLLGLRRVERDDKRNPTSVLQTLLAYGKSGTISRYLSVFESACVHGDQTTAEACYRGQ